MISKKNDKIVNDLVRREYFIPIVKPGGLEIAFSIAELIKLINNAVEKPTKLSSQKE
jgi:hypothetical protein